MDRDCCSCCCCCSFFAALAAGAFTAALLAGVWVRRNGSTLRWHVRKDD